MTALSSNKRAFVSAKNIALSINISLINCPPEQLSSAIFMSPKLKGFAIELNQHKLNCPAASWKSGAVDSSNAVDFSLLLTALPKVKADKSVRLSCKKANSMTLDVLFICQRILRREKTMALSNWKHQD